ncbi:hypothetical protein [Solwaraspora sp. WMMA2065]|uniref:hypothetical protein n=1 Tax=Solwaraspora sp. WMMA2065 TaxID=3015166 RepID=UPI0033905F6A
MSEVETHLDVILPELHKAFMVRYGGGRFGFVELFPIVSHDLGDEDLRSVNDRESPTEPSSPSPPSAPGIKGFPVTSSRCHDDVWFRFHGAGKPELDAADFLSSWRAMGAEPNHSPILNCCRSGVPPGCGVRQL